MFKTRHVVVILCITALAIMLVPTDALAQEVEGANTVTVSARQTVDIEPDLAIIVFGTQAKSRDASKALDNLAAKTNRVLAALRGLGLQDDELNTDRKSTRLNSSHANISYAVFCLKKK